MLFTIAAALTLAPALLTLGTLFGLFDPKQLTRGRLYRRIGASVVRWPVPILAASAVVVLIGAIFVPTYQVSYDDRAYQPQTGAANQGFEASDRHFPPSKLFTEMMMVESDHDMRNSADFISLDRVAKELVRLPGVAMVQSVTRPLGRPLDHANVPYLFTVQGGAAGQQLPFNEHQNDNTDQQAQIQAETVATLGKTIDLTQQLADDLHTTVLTLENLQAVTDEINSDISNLDDFMRPLKSYFYWEPHCYDIPVCYVVPIAVRWARRHRRPRRADPQRRHRLPGRRRAAAADGYPVARSSATRRRRCRPSSSTPTVRRTCSPPRPIRPSSTRSTWATTLTSREVTTTSTCQERDSTTRTSRPICG